MKRTILLLVALSIASGAYAKNGRDRNEITITYGQITAPQFAYMFGGVLGAAFSLGHFSFDHALMFGAAGVEYVHYVNNWLGFGGMVLCDYMTADAYSVASDGTKTPDGKYNLGFASAMPVVKFAWLNREHVGLYSKLACGVGYVFADQSSDPAQNITWSGQVTPIGVDFGGMSFRGFVEVGVGMQGVVSGGVRWLF